MKINWRFAWISVLGFLIVLALADDVLRQQPPRSVVEQQTIYSTGFYAADEQGWPTEILSRQTTSVEISAMAQPYVWDLRTADRKLYILIESDGPAYLPAPDMNSLPPSASGVLYVLDQRGLIGAYQFQQESRPFGQVREEANRTYLARQPLAWEAFPSKYGDVLGDVVSCPQPQMVLCRFALLVTGSEPKVLEAEGLRWIETGEGLFVPVATNYALDVPR